MTVYRSPSCGCCGVWVEHAKKHGFKVQDIKTEEMEALKQKYNKLATVNFNHNWLSKIDTL